MQSSRCDFTMRFHESICTVQSHEAVIPLQSTRCNLAMQFAWCNPMQRYNPHDAIPHETIQSARCDPTHNVILRTIRSHTRCNPTHNAIPRTMQSHVRCNSTKPPTQSFQYNKGRPVRMVHGGVDKKGRRHFAIFTHVLSTKCHPQRPWWCR